MSAVPTVLGEVEADALGEVLMHEHVFIRSLELDQDYPDVMEWDQEHAVETAVDRLDAAHALGVRTLVDLTVLQMGRSLPLVQAVAARTPVHIVAATGLYTYDELPYMLRFIGPGAMVDREEPMTGMFIRDITEGIGDTGVRAGIIKCATDRAGLTPGVERVLRAAARAHLETGVPISTHTDPHTRRGEDQQRVFESEGVDLSRVVIGHSGDTTDLDYLKGIADRGSYLGMDRFGQNGGTQEMFDARADTVARMCQAGYAGQMVLSHDTSAWFSWLPSRLVHGHPSDISQLHYTHIHSDVLPALRARGVTDEQIRTMLVDNPRRILSGE